MERKTDESKRKRSSYSDAWHKLIEINTKYKRTYNGPRNIRSAGLIFGKSLALDSKTNKTQPIPFYVQKHNDTNTIREKKPPSPKEIILYKLPECKNKYTYKPCLTWLVLLASTRGSNFTYKDCLDKLLWKIHSKVFKCLWYTSLGEWNRVAIVIKNDSSSVALMK